MWAGECVTSHGSKKPMVLRRQRRAIYNHGMNELDTLQSRLINISDINFENRKRPGFEPPTIGFGDRF